MSTPSHLRRGACKRFKSKRKTPSKKPEGFSRDPVRRSIKNGALPSWRVYEMGGRGTEGGKIGEKTKIGG